MLPHETLVRGRTRPQQQVRSRAHRCRAGWSHPTILSVGQAQCACGLTSQGGETEGAFVYRHYLLRIELESVQYVFGHADGAVTDTDHTPAVGRTCTQHVGRGLGLGDWSAANAVRDATFSSPLSPPRVREFEGRGSSFDSHSAHQRPLADVAPRPRAQGPEV